MSRYTPTLIAITCLFAGCSASTAPSVTPDAQDTSEPVTDVASDTDGGGCGYTSTYLLAGPCEADYDAELAVHTPEHPTVIALERQMGALQAQIDSGGASAIPTRSTLVTAAQQQITNLRTQLVRIEGEIGVLDGAVARTPKRGEELAALSERASVSREKYLDFLRKVNAAELAQTLENAQQGAQVSIMDRAFPPRTPESSRLRRLLMGIGMTLALVLGAGLFFEFLDPVLVASDQAEQITGLPELGSVVHIG